MTRKEPLKILADWRLPIALLLAVLALTYAVYLPGLAGPLLLDDLPQLSGIMDASDRGSGYLVGNFLVSSSGPIGRPVAMLSFIGDALLFGDDTWWWKHTNLLLHLVCGVLIFWLTSLLARTVKETSATGARCFGLVVAALWLLHPLNVSTVLYTVQRMTELSTLFVLAALAAYVKGRLVQEENSFRGSLFIVLGLFVFFPLGVLSKENALLLPLYVSLVEWLILRFRGGLASIRRLHWFLVGCYALAGVLVLLNFSAIVLDAYANRDFTMTERLLTQFRIVSTYIGQTLLPMPQNMGFFHNPIDWSTGLFSPPVTAVALAFLAGLVAIAFLFRRRRPIIAFGVLLFFASHLMESTVLGLELMFEHRNYLGSFGLLLAVADAVAWLVQSLKFRVIVAAAGVMLLGFLTLQRVFIWSSVDSFYEFERTVHPDSARVNQVFAFASAEAGDFDAARKFLDKSGSILDKAMMSVLFDCLEHGRIDDRSIDRVIGADYDFVAAAVVSTTDTIVREVVFHECKASAASLMRLLDHALSLRVRSAVDLQNLYFAKALAAEWAGDVEGSLAAYLAAQGANPGDTLATYQAADLLARHGYYDRAIDMLGSALAADAESRIDRHDLAVLIFTGVGGIYADSGRANDALAVYERGRAAMPNRAVFHIKPAELLLTMGQIDAAARLLADLELRDFVDLDEYAEAIDTLAAELEEERQDAAGNGRD